MIARIWHGVTPATKSDEYFSYVKRTGVPAYQSTEGNLGVYVLRKIEGDQAHFLLVSFWDSLDSIAKFSGSDITKARYYPEDEKYLLELEPTVNHYEVLVEP